jgi:hypothetical protein
MQIEKKVLAKLNKCYSVAPLHYRGGEHFLVAAEKQDPCYLFDLNGKREETVWEGPGGVMSMVQIPGTDGQFLATQKFYSPNDSKDAELAIAAPCSAGGWKLRTLVHLPFVHRFDLLTARSGCWLIACTLKSAHEYKEDWRTPGAVYAAKLPDDLSSFGPGHELPLTLLRNGMLRNHGYCRLAGPNGPAALICAENGVFRFTPPAADGSWHIELLLAAPASDAVLLDLDGDGMEELVTITPFHGNSVVIYHASPAGFREVYRYATAEFAHAIWGGIFCGRPSVIIGHRKGARDLLCFSWNGVSWHCEEIDHDCGPANVLHYGHNGHDVLISANRETDEIAMYLCSE